LPLVSYLSDEKKKKAEEGTNATSGANHSGLGCDNYAKTLPEGIWDMALTTKFII
jgi:hypothetical protein